MWPYSDSFCGGIIIGKTKVLTAYHCTIKSLQTHEVFQNEDLIVAVGKLLSLNFAFYVVIVYHKICILTLKVIVIEVP